MFFWGKKKRERALRDALVEETIAEVNKESSKASSVATAHAKKLNSLLKRDNVALNLYYATHTKGKLK